MTTIDQNGVLSLCTPEGSSKDNEWLIYMLHSVSECVRVKAKPIGFVRDKETKVIQRRFLVGSWMHVKESHE